jgi:hypothetical protein
MMAYFSLLEGERYGPIEALPYDGGDDDVEAE